jgi:hypothetical protein
MMVSRSGGGAAIIADIERRCDEHSKPDSEVQPPESECCILHNGERFLRSIVIASKSRAIVRAMQTFPNHHGLQECCCLALG